MQKNSDGFVGVTVSGREMIGVFAYSKEDDAWKDWVSSDEYFGTMTVR